uniref:Uncharacterized protein n=1 Tax=Panagrolaimus sp. PS1159 TaxID=55785 RepID=A0AC35G9S2_9BILA
GVVIIVVVTDDEDDDGPGVDGIILDEKDDVDGGITASGANKLSGGSHAFIFNLF